MNFLKKGPDLKLPDKLPAVKVPKPVNDVYCDLRDRRLLPLVGLLIVAIVAVPILLSETGEEAPATPPVVGSAGTSKRTSVVVAKSTPGLRDFRKRLAHRDPSNPFKQQYKNGGGGAERAEGTNEEAGSPETAPEETSGGGITTTGVTRTTHYFTYTIDVRVVPVSSNGVPSKAEPYVLRNLEKVTPLPAKKVPALTYIQISPDEEKALMLVNDNVKGLFGEGVCVSGGETCQLLSLAKGQPETVVYGGNERVFRIELLKVNVVETDPPKQTPKQGG